MLKCEVGRKLLTAGRQRLIDDTVAIAFACLPGNFSVADVDDQHPDRFRAEIKSDRKALAHACLIPCQASHLNSRERELIPPGPLALLIHEHHSNLRLTVP